MSIRVENVTKVFDGFVALRDVSVEVRRGELLALLGPSGSGKTTLLRLIAGLEHPDAGAIRMDDEDVADRDVAARGVGFVFQHYALFRHMSVFENVAFGLRVKPRAERPSDAEIDARVHRLLGLVQLDGLAHRLPAQLSGGQRQRIALARALAIEPRVLLLDEPFGALDARVRQELRDWLRRLHDELHVTSVFVTHDQEEALELADRVVVMDHGRIEQVGTPDEVFHAPTSRFVMEFIGHVNRFRARFEDGRVCVGDLRLPHPKATASGDALLFVRPCDVELLGAPQADAVSGKVLKVNSAGPVVRVTLELASGEQLQGTATQREWRRLGVAPGGAAWARFHEPRVFPA